MKKVFLILQRVWSILVILVAFVFVIIEGRLVFSGDWLLYENAIFGLMQYCFRFLLAIVALGIGVCSWISSKNAWYGSIVLLGISIIYVCFATNYIGELVCIISSVYLILSGLYLKCEVI